MVKSLKPKVVIGVTGKAGSGKDTIGDYLVENYGFVKMAMADPLKSGVQNLFHIDDETMYDREKREEPLADFPDWSVRKILQFVGTDLLRNQFDKDIWVKLMLKKLRLSSSQKIVICDIRFPNELNCIRDCEYANGHFFRVVRNSCDVGDNVGLGNHESETHELDYDHEFSNDGTFEGLYKQIDKVMKEI